MAIKSKVTCDKCGNDFIVELKDGKFVIGTSTTIEIKRRQAIDALIPDAELLVKDVVSKQLSKDDAFEAAAFSAAMNWLAAGKGLRVLTHSDRKYAEMLYGKITA